MPSLRSPQRQLSPASFLDRPLRRRSLLAGGLALGLRDLAGLSPGLPLEASPLRTRPAALAFPPDSPLLALALRLPAGVAVAPDGALYLVDSGRHCVRRIEWQGATWIVAGLEGLGGYVGEGPRAVDTTIQWPGDIAVAPDDALYIADTGNDRVRRVNPDGTIVTVAGNGERGFSGDGGAAIEARLCHPESIAIGPDGVLYIADSGNDRVRMVDPHDQITTIAGSGIPRLWSPYHLARRFEGDGGPATGAQLNWPSGVALAPDGALYIADTQNQRIRRIDRDGVITTVAGGARSGPLGDGGPATQARLSLPHGVAATPDGGLYIAETGRHRVRRVEPDGTVQTVAGNSASGFSGDGGPATAASLWEPWRVAPLPGGQLLIVDRGNHRLRLVTSSGTIVTLAGSGALPPPEPDLQPGAYEIA